MVAGIPPALSLQLFPCQIQRSGLKSLFQGIKKATLLRVTLYMTHEDGLPGKQRKSAHHFIYFFPDGINHRFVFRI